MKERKPWSARADALKAKHDSVLRQERTMMEQKRESRDRQEYAIERKSGVKSSTGWTPPPKA